MMRMATVRRRGAIALVTPLLFLCLHGAARAEGDECRTKSYEGKIPCYKQLFESIIQTRGTEQALDTLQRLSTEDPHVRQEAHPYTHYIGRFSFSHYKNVATAFAHCKDTFWSGCYHGVLEGYLGTLKKLEPKHIAPACSVEMDPQRPVFMKYQCVHGLGHGLTRYFQNDVFKALTFCDALPTAWDQESCYGGVFMENVIAFQIRARGDAHHAAHTSYLDPQNPLYPCTVVDRRYQRSCYLMQSSAVLTFNNYDFAKGFPECDKAPPDLVATCYRSMGRDASGYSLTDPEKTKALCLLARPDYIGQCYVGAAKDFSFTHSDLQHGIALCRIVDAPYKADCYAGIHEILGDFLADPKKRDEACQTAEEPYRTTCRGTTP